MIKKHILWCTLMVVVVAFATPSQAEDGRSALGVRTDLGLGSGTPTNDIVGYSLYGLYELNERWNLGFGVDHSPEFDFERTPDLLGFATPEVTDAKGTSTTVSGWIERVYRRPESRFEWFWNAGLGLNSIDMKNVAGPLVGGGAYDIKTDTGSEFQAMLGVGARRWFAGGWGLELAVHNDQHFADWKVTDSVSGASGTISDYSINTINLGFLKKF